MIPSITLFPFNTAIINLSHDCTVTSGIMGHISIGAVATFRGKLHRDKQGNTTHCVRITQYIFVSTMG